MSKCINVCELDETNNYCIGCKRTILEIMRAGIAKPSTDDYPSEYGIVNESIRSRSDDEQDN